MATDRVSFGEGSAAWTLVPHFRVSAVFVLTWGIWYQGLVCAFSVMWAWSIGLLDTKAGLCYGGLLTFIGNPIRPFRL